METIIKEIIELLAAIFVVVVFSVLINQKNLINSKFFGSKKYRENFSDKRRNN